MERRNDRHTQLAQSFKDITACPSPEDAVFMLQGHHIHVIDIQEIGGAAVGFDIPLSQFEPYTRRVFVACFCIIDWKSNARRAFVFNRHSLTQIGGKCGDSAPVSW